jgi:pimeloyl-ACP methyl ester carboxylesterase
MPPLKEHDLAVNGISLHVTEQGEGPAVLFCHGFPDTSYTWRRQMKAIASEGYRAIAPDMRGYGRSSAPADATSYTPLQTAGDLVGLLDELKIPSAVLVGHDWGATHAWNAAMMRPDRFKAVFCLSVPYVPRGDISVFERMRIAGHQNDFYMFEQIPPEARFGLTLQPLFRGSYIGRQVRPRLTRDGTLSILREAFTDRLPAPYPPGRSQITSSITLLNSSVPVFTVASTTTALPNPISTCRPRSRARRSPRLPSS